MPPSLHPACPVCRSAATERWTQSGYPLYECSSCTHLFCMCGTAGDYVVSTYGDDYFEGGGGGYSNYLQHHQLLVEQGKRYAAILARHMQHRGRILDIGAAAGFLLKGLVESGWQGMGIEPNLKMASHARDRLGLNVVHGTFEQMDEGEPFDAAMLIQVISHLRDPLACLKRANRMLRPGGVILIETWDRKSLSARIFGKRWHQYNPPSVLHWYSRPHLTGLLGQSGFDVIDRGRPTKWISIGNGVSLLRHSWKDSIPGRLATLPLTLVPKGLKVPYFLNDVFWFLARKRTN